MTFRFHAKYENGVLKPEGGLPVPEGGRYELAIVVPERAADDPAEQERRRKLLAELHRLDTEADAEPDDGYDLLRALDENRRRGGERPLLPEPKDQPCG